MKKIGWIVVLALIVCALLYVQDGVKADVSPMPQPTPLGNCPGYSDCAGPGYYEIGTNENGEYCLIWRCVPVTPTPKPELIIQMWKPIELWQGRYVLLQDQFGHYCLPELTRCKGW